MPKINKTSLVNHSSKAMYALVENIEGYPNFLPWCVGSSSMLKNDGSIVATVNVLFKGIPFTFSTINLNEPTFKITMKLADGPFKSMFGYWEFIEIDDSSCKVNFFLQYAFSNFIIEKATGFIFNELYQSLIDAFIKQADANEK